MPRKTLKPNKKPPFFAKLYSPGDIVDDIDMESARESLTNSEQAVTALELDTVYRVVARKGCLLYSILAFGIASKEAKIYHLVSVKEGEGAASFLLDWIKNTASEKKLAAITLNPLDKTDSFYKKHGFTFDCVNNMIFVL